MKKQFSRLTSQLSYCKGFTLIELLVSMMVVMVIGSVLLVVFFSALRGSQKTKTLIDSRQEGNYVLEKISRLLRQAESIENPDTCSRASGSTRVEIVSGIDKGVTTLEFLPDNIASISGENTATEKTYLLLDSSSNLELKDYVFTCGTREATDTPYVTVSFTLTMENAETQTEDSQTVFTNTILLRNAAF